MRPNTRSRRHSFTKFASFVDWPEDAAEAPVCIGVLGHDPFGRLLDRMLEGKSVGHRPFEARRLKAGADLRHCQIVFISASEQRRLRSILEGVHGAPVLTVGDTPGFCESGGMVNLAVADNRVRLQVNLEAATKAGLMVSSRLLSLATIVRSARP
jgi:hypothetical protein